MSVVFRYQGESPLSQFPSTIPLNIWKVQLISSELFSIIQFSSSQWIELLHPYSRGNSRHCNWRLSWLEKRLDLTLTSAYCLLYQQCICSCILMQVSVMFTLCIAHCTTHVTQWQSAGYSIYTQAQCFLVALQSLIKINVMYFVATFKNNLCNVLSCHLLVCWQPAWQRCIAVRKL